MIRRARRATRILVLMGATALAVYVLGGLCLAVTSCDQALWPCNTLVLCVMLRLSRNGLEDVLIYVGVVLAGVLANLHTGADAFLALIFGLANAGSVAMAVLLARRFAPLRFRTATDGWRFCAIVGLGPPALGAFCAWLAAVAVQAPDPLITARNWYLADLLGFLVLAPYGMTLSWRQIALLKVKRPIASAAAYAAGLTAATLGVFVVAKAPMIFTLLPLMLAATYHFRLWGAAASVLIVTAVAIPATITGHGPLAQAGPTARILLLQGLLALNALTCATLAALFNERDTYRRLLDLERADQDRPAPHRQPAALAGITEDRARAA